MSPWFRVAHEGSMVGPFKSQVASYAQHTEGGALTIKFNFSNIPLIPCHISAHFHSIFTAFLPSTYLYSDTK